MLITETLGILKDNSLNEATNITVDYVDEFIGKLVEEGYIRSAANEICYNVPLTRPTGYAFGAIKDKLSNKIKINRKAVQVKDHFTITEITKEVLEDIMNQYGRDGISLLVDLIKRDLFIEQDDELFAYINSIAKKDPTTIRLNELDYESGMMKLKTYVDEQSMKIAGDIKAPNSPFVIGSPKAIGLLMLDDNEPEKRTKADIYSYVGSLGQRDLFVDYNATSDYILIGLNGEETLRGITFCPFSLSTTFHTHYQDGATSLRVNNRYDFIRNPLDNEGLDNSRFFVRAEIVFADDSIDFNEFKDAFEKQLTEETDIGVNP